MLGSELLGANELAQQRPEILFRRQAFGIGGKRLRLRLPLEDALKGCAHQLGGQRRQALPAKLVRVDQLAEQPAEILPRCQALGTGGERLRLRLALEDALKGCAHQLGGQGRQGFLVKLLRVNDFAQQRTEIPSGGKTLRVRSEGFRLGRTLEQPLISGLHELGRQGRQTLLAKLLRAEDFVEQRAHVLFRCQAFDVGSKRFRLGLALEQALIRSPNQLRRQSRQASLTELIGMDGIAEQRSEVLPCRNALGKGGERLGFGLTLEQSTVSGLHELRRQSRQAFLAKVLRAEDLADQRAHVLFRRQGLGVGCKRFRLGLALEQSLIRGANQLRRQGRQGSLAELLRVKDLGEESPQILSGYEALGVERELFGFGLTFERTHKSGPHQLRRQSDHAFLAKLLRVDD